MSTNDLLQNTLFENIRHSNETFSKHFHDTYTVGLTHKGMMQSINGNNTYNSFEYSTRVNNPGELHCGVSNSWNHSNFYPSIEIMSSIYTQIFYEKKIPIFSKHLIEDPILYKKLHKFFYAVFTKEEKIIIETSIIEALSYLILNYTATTKSIDNLFDNKIIIKDSIELINDSIKNNLSLDELSANVKLSKYHFLRVFKKELGLTPHQYILMKKIDKTRDLILSGSTILDASLELGFNDQSHFNRNFKKLYGYTPASLTKNKNIIKYL